ncbi:MAG: hypothetical protein AB3N28_07215 [Kordiimonas sp.]
MAFLGSPVSFSSLFGVTNQQSFRPQIIGLGGSLISASIGAKLAQSSLNSLSAEDRASFGRRDDGEAVIPPWQVPEETQSLDKKVRAVRELSKFIDLKDDLLDSVKGDADRTATFALFRALTNLQTLAEYAADDKTSTASLERLDKQFQKGLAEIRDYLSTTELDKLDLFLGDKEYKAETAVRTGKNDTSFRGSVVASSSTQVLEGLTGTEVFTVSITKNGETDDISVDLSEISGDLTLQSVTDLVNSKIEAVTALDDEGEEYIKHQTRFVVASETIDTGSGTSATRYGLKVEGTLTEEVKFSAASSEPTLYVTSAVTQLDDSFATTSRVSEFNGLSGTLAADDTTSFAGIDLQASDIKERTKDTDDSDLSDALKAQRDKFRADALEAAKKAAEAKGETFTDPSATDDADDSSLTNINSDSKVNADTAASRVVVDSEGGIYVVGTSAGSLGHQINTASDQDVFLTKFDTEGNVVFSRLLGVDSSASVQGLTIDSDDNVILVGQTKSALTNVVLSTDPDTKVTSVTGDQLDSSNGDLFVTKISKRGDEVFRYQLDALTESGANSVAVDSSGDIYVGGYTAKSIPVSEASSVATDATILKLSGSNGAVLASQTYDNATDEAIKGIVVDANDNLVVAVEEDGNAVVRRISGSDLSNETSNVSLGSLGTSGAVQGITIDNANGKVYVAGFTTNTSLDASGAATVNGSTLGGHEGFLSGFSLPDSTGLSADFTTYLSTSGSDKIADITVQNGTIYVAGSTTGELSGETKRGSTDGFVAKVSSDGTLQDIEQFGESLSHSRVSGVAFTDKGNSVLETLGLPQGTVEIDQTLDVANQTTARTGDYFYISIDGGRNKKITLDEGDTFQDIARKLRITGIGKLDIKLSTTSEGDKISVGTKDGGVSVDLIPGSGSQDLLTRIGLKAGRLLPRDEVLGLNKDDKTTSNSDEGLGGVFGLKLEGALHIKDKTTAKYVLGLIDSAMSTVQRAHRSLEFNPFRDLLNNNSNQGTVPPHLQAQLANFQTGLARLQAGSPSSGVSLFV